MLQPNFSLLMRTHYRVTEQRQHYHHLPITTFHHWSAHSSIYLAYIDKHNQPTRRTWYDSPVSRSFFSLLPSQRRLRHQPKLHMLVTNKIRYLRLFVIRDRARSVATQVRVFPKRGSLNVPVQRKTATSEVEEPVYYVKSYAIETRYGCPITVIAAFAYN